MTMSWVLVADSASARIFNAPTPTGPLEELEAFAHPEARLPARALTSDLPGRRFDSGGPGKSAMESQVGPKQQEAIAFAKLLADRVGQARARGEIARLIVVAPPEFLGHLRAAIDSETRRRVTSEHALNLVRMKPAEIRSHLPEKLYSTVAPR